MRKLIQRSARLTFLLTFALVGCDSPEPPTAVTLKLNWKHGVEFLGFYIAQARGYYAREGLKVAIEPLSDAAETTSVFERVAAGGFDFSIGGLSLMRALSS